MKKGIIGKKVGMSQLFDGSGKVIPVTVIVAGPCTVIAKKTTANEGYESVVFGFGDVKDKLINKPNKGQFTKASVAPKRVIKEFRFEDCSTYNVGDIVKADVFAEGDRCDVTGTSKGKGFAGVIKRWNFSRLKMTHGSGPVARHGGSNGANTDPSRVVKGKKMPGRLGGEQVTIQNLSVVKIDTENNLIAIKGAIPGPKGSVVFLKNTVKA